MNKKDNIFYFFLVALALHLSLFVVKQQGVKGDAPVSLKSNSAPVTVKIKSPVVKKESIVAKKEVIPPTSPKEEKKPETKKIETPKKEIVKPDVKSKIKDKKKIEKPKEKKIEKISPKSQPRDKVTNEKKNIDNQQMTNQTENILSSGNFTVGKDGVFTASSSDGIDYKILKQIEPNYPIQAERIRYRKKVIVSVRFLVGLKGEIEKIEITQSHKKFGFDDEVEKALKQWKFHPIYYKNKNIKVFFTKDFVFEPK